MRTRKAPIMGFGEEVAPRGEPAEGLRGAVPRGGGSGGGQARRGLFRLLFLIAFCGAALGVEEVEEVEEDPQRCDVSFMQRLKWGRDAVSSLTASAGFSAAAAKVQFSPMGSISNPAGSYGTIIFRSPDDAFPGPSGADFCSCLRGNTSVSAVCDTLDDFLSSGGDREDQCKGTYVLAPSDAVVVVGCAPPEAQYFALQTNVMSKWLIDDDDDNEHNDGKRGGEVGEGGGCYDGDHEPIANCTCDASCSSCGYDDDPTDDEDCVTCTDGGSVQAMYADGTGRCNPHKKTALFFPEVSPLDTINHLVLNSTATVTSQGATSTDAPSPFGSAYVVVSSADAATARTVVSALVAAGVPPEAVNVDRLYADSIRFWDRSSEEDGGQSSSGPAWEKSLPDTLQMIFRINGPADGDATDQYIRASAVGSQRAWILRAPTSASSSSSSPFSASSSSSSFSSSPAPPSEPLRTEWRPRVATAAETAALGGLSSSLDALAAAVNASAAQQGLALSYYGDFLPSEDFGYVPEGGESDDSHGSSDVDTCCLSWPYDDAFWTGVVHFSTRDSLYEDYGLSGATSAGSDWPIISSYPRAMDTSHIGPPPPNVSTYYRFLCQGEDGSGNASGFDALYLEAMCADDSCGACGYEGKADVWLQEGCNPYETGARHSPSSLSSSSSDPFLAAVEADVRRRRAKAGGATNGPLGSGATSGLEYTCVDGVPTMNFYASGTCKGPPAASVDIGACTGTLLYDNVTDAMWAGGFLRKGTVVVVLGAMSDALGSSVFHDLYFPVSAAGSAPQNASFDFVESDLTGSASAFGDGDASSSSFDDLFVAQWGRNCVEPSTTAEGGGVKCISVDDGTMPDNSTFYFIVRHYLDPQTRTGPSKDALPRHRAMVFDSAV